MKLSILIILSLVLMSKSIKFRIPNTKTFILPVSESKHCFLVNVSIGVPRQNFSLLLDTGSTWLQTFSSDCKDCSNISNLYNLSLSRTVKQLGEEIELSFGGGQVFSGEIVKDIIWLGDTYNVTMNISHINSFKGVLPHKLFDGVLGLSFNYEFYKSSRLLYPQNILVELHKSKIISKKTFALDMKYSEGKLIFGVDLSKSNKINWVKIINASTSFTWNVPVSRIADLSFDNPIPFIVDTGTAAMSFPSAIQKEFYNRIGGRNCITYKQITKCDCSSADELRAFVIKMGNYDLTFRPQYYAVFKQGKCKMRINFNDHNLLGYPLFKNYLTVFDLEGSRLGLIGYYDK